MVGVNDYVIDEPIQIPLLQMDPEGEKKQFEGLKRLRKDRNASRYEKSLSELEKAAETKVNVMPFILEAAKADATLGEITDVLRKVYGTYNEPPIF